MHQCWPRRLGKTEYSHGDLGSASPLRFVMQSLADVWLLFWRIWPRALEGCWTRAVTPSHSESLCDSLCATQCSLILGPRELGEVCLSLLSGRNQAAATSVSTAVLPKTPSCFTDWAEGDAETTHNYVSIKQSSADPMAQWKKKKENKNKNKKLLP